MGQINFSFRPPSPLPAQLMYPSLVVVSFMIYISIRFEKKKTNSGAVSCLAGSVRQSFGSFLFLRFCFFLACGPTWVLGIRGFGGLAGLFLFLIISFSRFQYFNLHFGSLKLCFTNLVLEIQVNLFFCLH